LRALLLSLTALVCASACAPIGIVQEARVLGKGLAKGGVALTVAMPMREGVLLEPDGEGTAKEEQDLGFLPLPAMVGWYRHGIGGKAEFQVAFEVPSTTTSVSYKQGLFGVEPDSPFGMAIALDLGSNTVFGQSSMGGTAIFSGTLTHAVRWHLNGRVGTWPPLWALPHVTVTGGVSWGQSKIFHARAGWVFDMGSGAPPAALLLFGYESSAPTRHQPLMPGS
jgi:hypothetical protein